MNEKIKIKVATIADIAGMVKLQSENQLSQGGTLSGELNQSQIVEMMKDMPQIVAYLNSEIIGFILTTSQAVHSNRNVPIVNAMFASYSGINTDSYIYGPVCVNGTQRGKGVAQQMFKELLYQEPNREGILFIKSDNESSLRAHEKMGIKKVGNFNFNNAEFAVCAYLFSLNED